MQVEKKRRLKSSTDFEVLIVHGLLEKEVARARVEIQKRLVGHATNATEEGARNLTQKECDSENSEREEVKMGGRQAGMPGQGVHIFAHAPAKARLSWRVKTLVLAACDIDKKYWCLCREGVNSRGA